MENDLAVEVATAMERTVRLLRSLTPPRGLSFTSAATLSTLERSGPSRLTVLAERESVTQPAMTQVVARMQDAGLVTRTADPGDGRVVMVSITDEGRAELARRRAARAERLRDLLGKLSDTELQTLAAALPVIDALANMQPQQEHTR